MHAQLAHPDRTHDGERRVETTIEQFANLVQCALFDHHFEALRYAFSQLGAGWLEDQTTNGAAFENVGGFGVHLPF